MKRKIFLTLLLIFYTSFVYSLEYMPYPTADISEEQWSEYYEKMKALFGQTEVKHDTQGLATYSDPESRTQYAFTLPNHPAHPAWITRQVVKNGEGISMQQVGYFAGNEEEFAKLFKDYQLLNEEIQKKFKQ